MGQLSTNMPGDKFYINSFVRHVTRDLNYQKSTANIATKLRQMWNRMVTQVMSDMEHPDRSKIKNAHKVLTRSNTTSEKAEQYRLTKLHMFSARRLGRALAILVDMREEHDFLKTFFVQRPTRRISTRPACEPTFWTHTNGQNTQVEDVSTDEDAEEDSDSD